jgi:hypothetical protein
MFLYVPGCCVLRRLCLPSSHRRSSTSRHGRKSARTAAIRRRTTSEAMHACLSTAKSTARVRALSLLPALCCPRSFLPVSWHCPTRRGPTSAPQWTDQDIEVLRSKLEPLVAASHKAGMGGCVQVKHLLPAMKSEDCLRHFWPNLKDNATIEKAINSLPDFHFKDQHGIRHLDGSRKNLTSAIVPGKAKGGVSVHAPMCVSSQPLLTSRRLPPLSPTGDCRRKSRNVGGARSTEVRKNADERRRADRASGCWGETGENER